MKLRSLFNTNFNNDGTRSLFESILVPQVEKAFKDWKKNSNSNFVIIGGIALSYHVKPRTTTDIDVLYLNNSEIPESVLSFKKHRNMAFQHNLTHVEIEVLTPSSINMPVDVAQQIFNSAIVQNDIKIASKEGLIVSKLSRFSRQDQADIEALLLLGSYDFSQFTLSTEWSNKLEKIIKEI